MGSSSKRKAERHGFRSRLPKRSASRDRLGSAGRGRTPPAGGTAPSRPTAGRGLSRCTNARSSDGTMTCTALSSYHYWQERLGPVHSNWQGWARIAYMGAWSGPLDHTAHLWLGRLRASDLVHLHAFRSLMVECDAPRRFRACEPALRAALEGDDTELVAGSLLLAPSFYLSSSTYARIAELRSSKTWIVWHSSSWCITACSASLILPMFLAGQEYGDAACHPAG